MIGGTASTTSASSTLRRPIPRNATPIASTARLGSARQMLPRLIATNEPRWMWPSHSPIGSAITTEIAIPIPAIFSVPSVKWTSVGSGGSPGICPLRPMNLNACDEVVHQAALSPTA